MNQHPAYTLHLVLPATGPAPRRPIAPASDPKRAEFLADLARRRRDGTLSIDPLAIADAILRRER
jgi:hypothetical protein